MPVKTIRTITPLLRLNLSRLHCESVIIELDFFAYFRVPSPPWLSTDEVNDADRSATKGKWRSGSRVLLS